MTPSRLLVLLSWQRRLAADAYRATEAFDDFVDASVRHSILISKEHCDVTHFVSLLFHFDELFIYLQVLNVVDVDSVLQQHLNHAAVHYQ